MGILTFITSNQGFIPYVCKGRILLLVISFLLCACTTPEQKADDFAGRSNYTKAIVSGDLFEHVLYFKHSQTNNDTSLHIYIEGDGKPWLTPERIALDPTPEKALMLNLMAMDDHATLYLGRPCYFGLSNSRNCHPWYWTMGRYSIEVLDSMTSVLTQYLQERSFTKLVFIGYSGGGSIATLLAGRFARTSTLITIAGNIDTNAWIRFHDYSPLHGLNPVNSLPLAATVRQYHLSGGKDVNVPAFLTKNALNDLHDERHNVQLLIIPDYSHQCCWNEIWHEVLLCIKNACELKLHHLL